MMLGTRETQGSSCLGGSLGHGQPKSRGKEAPGFSYSDVIPSPFPLAAESWGSPSRHWSWGPLSLAQFSIFSPPGNRQLPFLCSSGSYSRIPWWGLAPGWRLGPRTLGREAFSRQIPREPTRGRRRGPRQLSPWPFTSSSRWVRGP